MVGHTVLKRGVLDYKPPSNSFFGSGWRRQPWKSRQMELVENQEKTYELQIYEQDDDNDIDHVYKLEDITDISMVSSKTHVHAFEIVSRGKSLVVLSGSTELITRDWIWILRKTFWPQSMAVVEQDDKLSVQLVPNEDTHRLGLARGIYDIDISVVDIRLTFLSKVTSSESDRHTPVEPFTQTDTRKTLIFPLTTIGRLKLEDNYGKKVMVIETTPDCHHGHATCVFTDPQDDEQSETLNSVMEYIKSHVFRATNHLHDLISSSQWRFSNTQ